MEDQTKNNSIIRFFLFIGKAEGYSYLLLLFIAMPLKYIFNHPEYVRIAGSIHGVLFVSFMISIFIMLVKKQFELKNATHAFLLSLLPFGTFFLKKTLKNNGK